MLAAALLSTAVLSQEAAPTETQGPAVLTLGTVAEQLLRDGVGAYEAGEVDRAEGLYWLAIDAEPKNPEAWNLLGIVERQYRSPRAAVVLFRRARTLSPTTPQYWANEADARLACGELQAADELYVHARSLGPPNAVILAGHGHALGLLGRHADALSALREAVRIDPDCYSALVNASRVLAVDGNYEGAASMAKRAESLGGDRPEARFDAAMSLIGAGKHGLGWGRMDARFALREYRDRNVVLPTPRQNLHAEIPKGATVLVVAEQGFGDTLWLARYVPELERMGHGVSIYCPPAMVDLLAASFPCEVRGFDREPAKHDVWAGVFDLPVLTSKVLPWSPGPYLDVPADRAVNVGPWQATPSPRPLRVGVCWRGARSHPLDATRSMRPADLEPLRNLPDAELFSLVVDPNEPCPDFLRPIEPTPRDWADTAGVIRTLDLVISVDTAVAHLAGGLGKPTLLLLAHGGEWRWGPHGEFTAWYPNHRIVRQGRGQPWEAVVAEVVTSVNAYRLAVPVPETPPTATPAP